MVLQQLNMQLIWIMDRIAKTTAQFQHVSWSSVNRRHLLSYTPD